MAGQENALDDALRWFPPGIYEGFIQLDRTFLPEDDLSSTLQRMMRAELKDTLLTRVPFLRNYESATLALAKTVDLGADEEGHGKKRRKETSGFLFFWHEMLVLRGPGFSSAMAKAEKQGLLERLPGKKNSPVVYRFQARAGKAVYLHLAESGEVLMCENRRFLTAMTASGSGIRPSILDDPDVAEMLTYVPSAPVWLIAPIVQKNRAVLAELVNEDAGKSRVESQKRKVEEGEQFYIVLIDAEDDVVCRELYVFQNAESAEAAVSDDVNFEGLGSPFAKEALIDVSKEVNGRILNVLQRYSLDKLRELRATARKERFKRK